ncbi:glycerol-3-phosphate cytidylyltransferase [Falsihalocynthiibacter sp. SS001]|uniref:glycerol-3-phosphate cytidylyltransferase n=1 Tax=Falsihalocynthiibacter sp. SS001 TaxID=3349698 RepID=UPI0036D3607D
MKTVITYGTFDLFHAGHVHLLRRCRALGDRLIVGCSTDEFNLNKGKKAVFSYEDRAEILKSCRYVDEVLPEESWDQKVRDVQSNDVQIFAIGDDWAGQFDFLADETGCVVTYLPRTPSISTTDVRGVIHALHEDQKISMIHNAERLLSLIKAL